MVPQQLHQLGVTLNGKAEAVSGWGRGRSSTSGGGAHLSRAKVGQVTFPHQIKGRADGSKDRDWPRQVQQRLELRLLRDARRAQSWVRVTRSGWGGHMVQVGQSHGRGYLQQRPQRSELPVVGDDLAHVLLSETQQVGELRGPEQEAAPQAGVSTCASLWTMGATLSISLLIR